MFLYLNFLIVMLNLLSSLSFKRFQTSIRSKRCINSCFSTRATSNSVSSDSNLSGDDYLFGKSDKRSSFNSLNLSNELCNALNKLNRNQATAIQSKSIPSILNGDDCVIASETGSGKTMAYMIPLLENMIRSNNDIENNTGSSLYHPTAVIMVPNKALCNQVYNMATELLSELRFNDNRKSFEIASLTAVTNSWPYYGRKECPDIIICTPAFLSQAASHNPNSHQSTAFDLYNNMKYLIMDEADMLLDGSYKKDIEKIMVGIKVTRRQLLREEEINPDDKFIQIILSAATIPTMGMLSIDKYISKNFPNAKRISNTHVHKHHPLISQQFIECHRVSPISEDQIDQVIDIMTTDSDEKVVKDPTMIFLNTADDAVSFADALRDRDIRCVEYHKLVLPVAERDRNLEDFKDHQVNVMVCTDHAARGLDLPFVRHVIQAQFADNVVHHMHRVGRASRAGAEGRATMFYDQQSKPLVESILQDKESNSIDSSFSRRRGLRRQRRRNEQRERDSESRYT